MHVAIPHCTELSTLHYLRTVRSILLMANSTLTNSIRYKMEHKTTHYPSLIDMPLNSNYHYLTCIPTVLVIPNIKTPSHSDRSYFYKNKNIHTFISRFPFSSLSHTLCLLYLSVFHLPILPLLINAVLMWNTPLVHPKQPSNNPQTERRN